MLNLFWIFGFLCLLQEVLSAVTNPKRPEKEFYELDNVEVLFKEFVEKHNKNYESEEFEYRQKVFAENLVKINRWNREQSSTTYGINPFTDLTFEEFIKTHAGGLGNFTYENAVKYEPIGMAPESLDWRDSNLVAEVKDQANCNSCYIFSAIGNIEGQHAKQSGQLVSLSEQQYLDCNTNGCSHGGLPHKVMEGLADSGCMKETDYSYEGNQGQCRMDKSKIAVKVTGGQQISVASEDELKDAVAQYGPLSIGVKTNPDWHMPISGILKPTSACNSNGHAVLLVGYGTDGSDPYWLIKNSWGTQWGNSGYVKLIRGQQACEIGSYVASATVA